MMKYFPVVLAVCAVGLLFIPQAVLAHCDTLDGPVVIDAKEALSKGDVAGILKWIKQEDEAEIRAAFNKTMTVRKQGPEARELADGYFLETLVRIHREGEGAPYTGLKPAGTIDPAVSGADKALETGKVDELVKTITDKVAAGVRQRFTEANEKRPHKEHNKSAGRDYVKAYVEFIHYVERLNSDAAGPAHDHGESAEVSDPQQHNHDEK